MLQALAAPWAVAAHSNPNHAASVHHATPASVVKSSKDHTIADVEAAVHSSLPPSLPLLDMPWQRASRTPQMAAPSNIVDPDPFEVSPSKRKFDFSSVVMTPVPADSPARANVGYLRSGLASPSFQRPLSPTFSHPPTPLPTPVPDDSVDVPSAPLSWEWKEVRAFTISLFLFVHHHLLAT